MPAGELNERIQLIGVAYTQGTLGESVPQDTATNTVWAGVRQQGSAEKQRNGITVTDDTFAIKIRFRTDVTTTTKLVYRGRTLDISSTMGAGRMNREWLLIQAEVTR